MAETVTVRGAGGVVFALDVPDEGTSQRELYDYQIDKGDLVIVEQPKAAAKKAAASSE